MPTTANRLVDEDLKTFDFVKVNRFIKYIKKKKIWFGKQHYSDFKVTSFNMSRHLLASPLLRDIPYMIF